jgi:DeoR/GlpR family transcriptional regulator of sugar metabolism
LWTAPPPPWNYRPPLEDLPLNKITFVTHSPVMAQRLSELGFAEIILLGGKLIKDLLITAGLDSIKQAEQFRPDLSIISAHGLSVPAGATVESWEDALLKRAFVERSAETVVIAGQEKLVMRLPIWSCLPKKSATLSLMPRQASA